MMNKVRKHRHRLKKKGSKASARNKKLKQE
jgi:hypothetical protein